MTSTRLIQCGYGVGFILGVSLLAGLPSCNEDSGCPSAAPTYGEACDLPEGTQCGNYAQLNQSDQMTCSCCGGSSASNYVCSGGVWSSGGVTDRYSQPNGVGACPTTAPNLGDSCNSYGGCGSPIPSCNYSCDDAGGSPFVMGCQDGQWILTSGQVCERTDSGIDGDSGDAATDASSDSGDANDGG